MQFEWGDALLVTLTLSVAMGVTIVVGASTGGNAWLMGGALAVLWLLSLGLLGWCMLQRPKRR